ncbi:MAG: glycosyltransferase [Erysipelotrichaceae bacterium]|nr:glycosyltransferase [Erysipelotrichaceae bacterium]
METDKATAKPILSIIVPVYNVEKYLDTCLTSLVNQTLENYEILVINDGTKDNSQDIIDKYVEKYPEKVFSFIKENGGLSDARNFGIERANGKYISFIDSDDSIDMNYYKDMIDLAEKDGLDLVVADLEYVWENNEKEPMLKEGLNAKVNPDVHKALFLSPLSVCNKLFRKDLFDSLDLSFYKGLWYEDIPVALLYCANAKKIGRITSGKYYYLQRSASILGSGYSPKMYDIFTIFEKVIAAFKEKGLYETYHDELEYLFIEHFLIYGAFRFLRTQHYQELMPKAFEFVKSYFPNYRHNPYISTLGSKNRAFLASNNTSTMGFWHWYLSRGYENRKAYENEIFVSTINKPFSDDGVYSKKLSIIVPVYNVEKYLETCLSSLVSQGLDDYEILVVNDGTKDNSQKIIDRFAEEFPDIVRPFIKENGGLSDARNFGLQRANGRYIAFIDSDDYAELNFYKGMLELAEKNNLDLVVADLEYVWENSEKEPMYKEGLSLITEEINKRLFLSPLFAWNKLYRHSMLKQLKAEYPVGLWYEDIPVTLNIFSHACRIGYYHHIGIHYLQRGTSILGSGYSPKMYDIFTIFDRVIASFKEKGDYDTYRDELEYLFIEHFLVYGAFRFLRTDHYKELMSKAFDYVKKEFPAYRKNKYIKTFGPKNMAFLFTNNRGTMSFWHWYLTK